MDLIADRAQAEFVAIQMLPVWFLPPSAQAGFFIVLLRPFKTELRRDGRLAEGAPLLREYGSKAQRGFEA